MKWPGCGTKHLPLLVLRSSIQRAIPILPLCACLTCNGTAFTFIDIQIPHKHITNNQTSASKNVCIGPRLPDLTPIWATFHSNSKKGFNVTHKISAHFTAALRPLNLLCNSRHVTTILLPAACRSITTARAFSFSVSKSHLNSWTSVECRDVSSSVNCSWCYIWYSSCLLTPWRLTTTIGVVPQRCILYIYSTNIGTEYFKHGVYSPSFSSSKCSLFHNSNLFGSCIIHILYTGRAEI